MEFWSHVDYIGVDAYYALARDETDPSLDTLQREWAKWVRGLDTLHTRNNDKEIVFTELGYRSMEGTNKCPGCWGTQGKVSHELQARLFEALFREVCTRKFFAGIFYYG